MKKSIVLLLLLIMIFSITCRADNSISADELFSILDQADRAVTWTLDDGSPDFTEIYGVDKTDGFKINRKEYYRVSSGFTSISELRAYFCNFMTPETADAYINLNRNNSGQAPGFQERSGKLYYASEDATLYSYHTSRETDKYEIIRSSNGHVTLRYYPCYEDTVRHTYQMDRDLFYDYEFELNSDGKYVVTNMIPTLIVYQGQETIDSFSDRLNIKSPQTTDSAIFITAVGLLSLLCGAMVCKKKKASAD